jgi:hypothetical protein
MDEFSYLSPKHKKHINNYLTKTLGVELKIYYIDNLPLLDIEKKSCYLRLMTMNALVDYYNCCGKEKGVYKIGPYGNKTEDDIIIIYNFRKRKVVNLSTPE